MILFLEWKSSAAQFEVQSVVVACARHGPDVVRTIEKLGPGLICVHKGKMLVILL